MPRRKLGLRTYHHKSRNGCSNCKRRRVKCHIQAPACTNCIRRNEHCEYPTFPYVFLQQNISGTGNNEKTLLDSSFCGDESRGFTCSINSVPAHPMPEYAGPTSGTLETTLTFPSPLRRSLSIIFNRTWFPHDEASCWIPVLEKSAASYPYVQHSILALSSLVEVLDDPSDSRNASRPPVTAYQHQIAASTFFRQVPPVVNNENWIAVLCFGVSNVVFHFAVQQARNASEAASEFSMTETFQMLRSSKNLSEEFLPYLRSSKFWPFIAQRVSLPVLPLDPSIRLAMDQLALVVTRAIETGEDNAEVSRQAFWDLREWVSECQGQPRVPKHLLSWPADVPDAYLLLLSQGDDLALLIFVHWCAFVYLSPRKWHITKWAKRTAKVAIGLLNADWGDILEWPLKIFATVPVAMPTAITCHSLVNPVLVGICMDTSL